MLNIDDYILGNGALHARFCANTEILAKVVSAAPRPVTVRQMAQGGERSLAELEALCASLARAGLLRRHDSERDSWVLARRAGDATLEDVFRSVLEDQPGTRRVAARHIGADPVQPEVALLVMQATMAINQIVFRHLRQFPLDRLKSRAVVARPAAGLGSAPQRGLRYAETVDFDAPRAGAF